MVVHGLDVEAPASRSATRQGHPRAPPLGWARKYYDTPMYCGVFEAVLGHFVIIFDHFLQF